jgi:uncharacterized protein YegL
MQKEDNNIINSYIELHNANANLETDFNIFENENIKYTFGILTIEISETPAISIPQMILSVNDISGSMSDLCKDKKSKIQHMNHTLKNIISLLKDESEENISIEIAGFHDEIEMIIPFLPLKEEKKEKIHDILDKKLIAKNGTNIEIALKYAKERFVSEDINNFKFPIKTHIFMTDGNANEGEENPEILKILIHEDVNNIFIGFGLDHDAILLQTLASCKNASYYYVDKIENAGFIFGEVLHEILYTALKNVKIIIENGEIYDYNTNNWSNTLYISSIVSEAKKTYHIRSKNPELLITKIQAIEINNKNKNNIIEKEVFVLPEIEGEKPKDLIKYMLRQRTQELLYKAHEMSKEINRENKLKNNIRNRRSYEIEREKKIIWKKY